MVNRVKLDSGGVAFYPYCAQHLFEGTFVFHERLEILDVAEILVRRAGFTWSFEEVHDGESIQHFVAGERPVSGVFVTCTFRADGEDAIVFAAPLFTPNGGRPADVLAALASIGYSQFEEFTFETFLSESGLDDDDAGAPAQYERALEYHRRGEAFVEAVQQKLGDVADFRTFIEDIVPNWA